MVLRSHVLLAARFGPFAVGEMGLACEMVPDVPADSLTVVDRGFLGAIFLWSLAHDGRNRQWLTRAKSTTALKKVRDLGPGDAEVEWATSSTARRDCPGLPVALRMRAIRYERRGFRSQTLLTSLLDPVQYPAHEIVDLYHERWELELAYDELKTELLESEETLRSRTPDLVAQEIWGILLAYQLVRLEMERVAAHLGVPPTRIGFVAAMRLIRDEFWWLGRKRNPGAIPAQVRRLEDRLQRLVLPPRRSERVFPRAVKIKMSGYPRKRPVTTGTAGK
jgi:hypothetical protein